MLKPWHVHGLQSGIRSRLPFADALRALKRKLMPYAPDPGNDDYLLENALHLVTLVRQIHGYLPARYTEVGAGWTPLTALVFHAAGCETILLRDLTPYLDEGGMARAKGMAHGAAERIAEAAALPVETVRTRIDAFAPDYRCPFDLLSEPAGTADLVVTRAVLEHVPEAELPTLVQGMAHVLSPGGIACHLIDNSDHFEHNDKTISRLNFLQYADRDWARIQRLTANWQNRLRHSDYKAVFTENGFRTLYEERSVCDQSQKALQSLPLAPRFREKSREDLAALTSVFVLTPGICD